MPVCETRFFGPVSYHESTELEFASGLPGFEEEKSFVAIDHPSTTPLVYLQSLSHASLCFVCLPLQLIERDYVFDLTEEDLAALGWHAAEPPRMGDDLLALAILSIQESGTTANLMAPVVASLSNRRAVQSLCGAGRYSHQHALSGSCGGEHAC